MPQLSMSYFFMGRFQCHLLQLERNYVTSIWTLWALSQAENSPLMKVPRTNKLVRLMRHMQTMQADKYNQQDWTTLEFEQSKNLICILLSKQWNKLFLCFFKTNALSSDFLNKCISLMSISDVNGRGATESMISEVFPLFAHVICFHWVSKVREELNQIR